MSIGNQDSTPNDFKSWVDAVANYYSGQGHLINWPMALTLYERPDNPYHKSYRTVMMRAAFSGLALMLAVEGEKPDIKGRFNNYLHFIETPVGQALSIAASEARKAGELGWNEFKASLGRPIFDIMLAASVWHRSLSAEPPNLVKSYVESSGSEAEFYQHMIARKLHDGEHTLHELFHAWTRLSNAARIKEKRGVKRRSTNEIKMTIQLDWLPRSLWTLSTKEIAFLYDWIPSDDIESLEDSCRKIDAAISELGFSMTRKSRTH